MQNSFTIDSLNIYKLAKRLSEIGWEIYQVIDWKLAKTTREQFLDSTDSVGANIVEGYGRFHYLDRVKFLYNARGSLLESKYWVDLLVERKILKNKLLKENYDKAFNELKPKLNSFINSIYKNRTAHLTNNK